MHRFASFPKRKATKAKPVSDGHPITYRWSHVLKVLPAECIETIITHARHQQHWSLSGRRDAAYINAIIADALTKEGN